MKSTETSTSIRSFKGDYRYLSNFWSSGVGFSIGGTNFASVEVFYQAAKAKEPEDLANILDSETPYEAKLIGNSIEKVENWDDLKVPVMKIGVLSKFIQNPDLAIKLINTGNRVLIEGNHWHDNFWGCCTCKECDDIGENRLGVILMETREVVKRIYGL